MNRYQKLIEDEQNGRRAKLFIKGFIEGFAICTIPVACFAVIAELIKRSLS
jgi:hypothetical protein